MKLVKKFPTFTIVYDRRHVATVSTAAKPIPGTIYLKVIYNKEYCFINIGAVYKDQIGRFVRGKLYGDTIHGRADADTYNRRILDEKASIMADFEQCLLTHTPWSIARLKAQKSNDKPILDYMRLKLDAMDIATSTRQSYGSYLKRIEQYGGFVTFDDLNRSNIEKFDLWLREQISEKSRPSSKPCHRIEGKTPQPLTSSAIHNIHTFLHKIVRLAKMAELVSIDPYDSFDLHKPKGNTRVWLSQDEIELFRKYRTTADCRRLKNPEVSRDIFLLQCYTGLAFIDLVTFDWMQCRENRVIIAPRHKTGVDYVVRLPQAAVDILERYGYKIPHITNQCYNEHLREIARAMGIKKHITSHCGRHTFATTYGLNAGVSIEVLARMLGHTNIKTTQIYAEMLPNTVIDAFDMVDAAINKDKK